MFNIGPVEMIVILAIALLVFGPRKLPEIGRTLGNAMREFRKASSDFMDAFHSVDLDLEPETRAPVKNIEYPDYPSQPEESVPQATPALSENYETLPYGADFYPEPEEGEMAAAAPADTSAEAPAAAALETPASAPHEATASGSEGKN